MHSRRRKGLALIEYSLIGGLVLLGSIGVVKNYSETMSTTIKRSAPERQIKEYKPINEQPGGQAEYGTPNDYKAPNDGGYKQNPNNNDPCAILSNSWLSQNIPQAQYNYATKTLGLTDVDLNSTVIGTDSIGKLQRYPKYIISKYIDGESSGNVWDGISITGGWRLYQYSGNPGDAGYVPGVDYRRYYAVGANYQDPNNSSLLPLAHPWIGPATSEAGSWLDVKDGGVKVNNTAWDSLTTHCTSFNHFETPLILDINGDGKVSAKAAIGVDIDGNGSPDGAAVNGDKMLAISDQDGNKKITGKEVFGDNTVDPFTKIPLKAKNGFIALKLIAQSAEKHTGIKCLDGKFVDLVKLNTAMKKAKVGKLGLISDKNVTKLEPLGKVVKISIDYKESNGNAEDTANIKHKQIGSWFDIKNVAHVIHDVWFALTKAVSNATSSIAKAVGL